ncbi:MAG: DUF1553 domain-containing protein [Saprospiraceae bacterium]
MELRTFIQLNVRGLLTMIIISLFSCQSEHSGDPTSNIALPKKVDFNFHIKPILSDRCFKCHGPDEKVREAKLRFDVKEGAFALLDSAENRYAIVPGDLKKSSLVHRVSSTDPSEMMPPPESNLSLSTYEIALLKKWIEQGAEWKAHWSFILPEKAPLPGVAQKDWPKHPIDYFTLAKMEEQGLRPSPRASKEKLIRRLSFDLRGLPPSLTEIDAFLADESPDAYEKLIDQFLTQDSYGERMAQEWLDVARYADSHGYQDDLERSMWPWRDWVIQAFNQNLPYDRFVSWQLAGDLLPNATYEQKLATGFNRNHKITQEVGVIDEEYRVTYVLDRVNTFSTVFMGLTVECAQCHDHKYDPISQKEFYSLFSFFNNVPEKGRVDYGVEVAEPSLPLPADKIAELRTYIRNLFDKQHKEVLNYASKQWAQGFEANQLKQTVKTSSIPKGLIAWYPFDYIENDQIREVTKGQPATVVNKVTPVQGKFSGGLAFMGTNYADLAPSAAINFNAPFTVSFWIKSVDGGIRGPVLTAQSKTNKAGFVIETTGDKTFNFVLTNDQHKARLQILSKETLPVNKWTHIALTYDGSRKSQGVKLYMNGVLAEDPYTLSDNLQGNISPYTDLFLGARNPQSVVDEGQVNENDFLGNNKGLQAGQLDELMIFNRSLQAAEIADLSTFNPIADLAAKTEKTETDLKRLFYHQLLHQDADYQIMTNRLMEYKIRKGRMEDIVLKPTMVMADMDTVRSTFVLERGQYDAPQEKVVAATPLAVLPFDQNYVKNRAGLVEWLLDPKNPLTARVAVNRYWQLIFGRGIVATPEDFGSQGALPSHPALLDWLAVDFRESGWDLKRLIKGMVLSATYQQSVETNSRLQQLDPENNYLARGPQQRLSAEMIRDHALAISGLLSSQIGGPSVKPYQPEGLWLQVASGNQSLRKYIQDHDQDLYRRSLYTFWKRTIPPPSMTVFDAPQREQCTVKRRATSTPMQALVLLNDPQFTEASRLIAVRMLKEGGETLADRVKFAFRLATSRAPSTAEVDLLIDLLEQEKADFAADPAAAKQLIAIGEYRIMEDFEPTELAAYTVVANAILNLTEAILKS